MNGGSLRVRLLLVTWAVVTVVVTASLSLASEVPRASGFGLALVGGALSALVVTTLATRWFASSVRPLTDAARRMYEGDLEARARVDREGDAEVTQAGAALDQLAARLSRSAFDLRTERDLLSRILGGMQEGVLMLDQDGRIALMNPALREMLLLRADAFGQPLLEVVRHAELKELFDRARKAKAPRSGEVELGGLKPRRLLVRASFDKEGGGILAVFFDVTDIRRLESLRRDFVANVSHELRTPVTAILSAAETLEIALEKDPEGARMFLGIVERNASRLQRLIEDLLDLSRIESRELRLRPERLAFEPFATHVLGMFRERADKKHVATRVECDPALEIEIDRRALEQILTNLIDNAVKYCSAGASVTVRAARAGAKVKIEVEDTGGGIDASHLPRLFERFYRVEGGRSRDMGGTGLGLAIVKHLTEAMGGTVDVKSVIGSGTTFEVTL